MRLIDADALMATLGITSMDCDKCAWHDREWSKCKRGGDFEDACCAIENAPTIEDLSAFCDKLWRGAYEQGKAEGKAERGTGKWIRSRRPRSYERWCSECGEKSWYCGTGDYTFCPHCGADMRGEESDCDYERAVEQLEHDMLYEPTFNPDDGSM